MTATLLATGCGTVATSAVQAQLSGKSITVVSLVGETVQLSWRGTTPFNNEFGEARVPDWGLRTRIEDKAVATLEAMPQLASGEVLEVITDCPQSINNIPLDAENHGYKVLAIEQHGPTIRYLIQR